MNTATWTLSCDCGCTGITLPTSMRLCDVPAAVAAHLAPAMVADVEQWLAEGAR